MRGPTPREMLETQPPELRSGSRVNQALLDLREKILDGKYQVNQELTTKNLKDTYGLNTIESQVALLRLAIEGLVSIQSIQEKKWPHNAAYNEYRVADLNIRHRMLSTRQGDFVSDISQSGYAAFKETLQLEIQYADAEIASLLEITPGDPVVFHRNLQRRDRDSIVAICDSFIPFWFAEQMPKMRQPDYDIYQLMRQLGKDPYWCEETVDMTQASSVERVLFGLSPDDPVGLFKILRRSFDREGHPLELQFLSDLGKTYRLYYSFPLFADEIPEAIRQKREQS
jgi:DNA-binding GntR family transcriptional regulator